MPESLYRNPFALRAPRARREVASLPLSVPDYPILYSIE